MKRYVQRAILGLAGFSLVAATAVTAQAAESAATQDSSAASSQSSVSTAKGADELCEQARKVSKQRGPCATETTSVVSAADTVTAAEVDAADLDLVAADGTTLSSALAAGTIYTRTWWQEKRGLYYVNWLEKHTGRIYWDGARVWSTTLYRGYKGTHVCDQGFGILYDIRVTSCSTENLGYTRLREWDYFRVHVVWQGIPLYASHNMYAQANYNGSMSFSG